MRTLGSKNKKSLEIKRDKHLQVRVTVQEYESLKMNLGDINMSDYIRRSIGLPIASPQIFQVLSALNQ